MKILIVDDYATVRRGLAMILKDAYPAAEIGEASDSREAIEQVQAKSWDLVMLDITLPGRNGIEVLKELKTVQPATPVLIQTMHPEEQFAVRALKEGAAGYLRKDCPPPEILEAVKTVLSGNKYLTRELATRLANSLRQPADVPPHEKLSNREFEVFRLLAAGKGVKEVAAELGLSVKTISTHREHILQKMQMPSNAALTVYAVKNGLID